MLSQKLRYDYHLEQLYRYVVGVIRRDIRSNKGQSSQFRGEEGNIPEAKQDKYKNPRCWVAVSLTENTLFVKMQLQYLAIMRRY